MKMMRYTLIFLALTALPMGTIYFMSSDILGIYLSIMWFISVGSLLIYADKVILFTLKAREVIEADYESFFQAMKRESYHRFSTTPKLYLYSGNIRKCFLLEARGQMSFVLDRQMIDEMNNEEILELVSFLIEIKKDKSYWLQTKGMAINSVVAFLIYKTSHSLSFGRAKETKLFTFLGFTLFKPLMEIIEWLTKSKQKKTASEALKTLYFKSQHGITIKTLSEYIGIHLEEDSQNKDFLVEYLETFPTLENCDFERSLYVER